MKKYILFISLCLFIFAQLGAVNVFVPQDSIYIYKGKINPSITIYPGDLDLDFEVDTNSLLALKESLKVNEGDLSTWKESLNVSREELRENLKDLRNNSRVGTRVRGLNQQSKTPKRTETKTFTGISEIEFFHQYGNIVVRESKSKQVELEIQYFGSRNQNDQVNISTQKGLLSINSRSTSGAQVDFIINIPRNTELNINLKYGKVKMDDFRASFSSNLSYSSLDAGSLSGAKTFIKDKYGKISIAQAQDINVDASYSKVNIAKARQIDLSSKYSDYVIDDVQNLFIKGASSGDFKIGSISNMTGDLNYADIKIGNLVSGISTKCNYSDIQINSISPRANINVKSNYSDVTLSIPQNISTSFNVSLNHGDIVVSKKYQVKYTEQTESGSTVVKRGQIGSGKPTAVIEVVSNYADVKIR